MSQGIKCRFPIEAGAFKREGHSALLVRSAPAPPVFAPQQGCIGDPIYRNPLEELYRLWLQDNGARPGLAINAEGLGDGIKLRTEQAINSP